MNERVLRQCILCSKLSAATEHSEVPLSVHPTLSGPLVRPASEFCSRIAPGQALQGWLHLLQAPAQVLAWLQAHGRHLDQQGMHSRGHHGLQEGLLGLVPHVGQGHQAQASAHLPGKQAQLSGAQQCEKHVEAGHSACRQAGTQPGMQAGATVSWSALLVALQAGPRQEPALGPCMLRQVDTAGRLRYARLEYLPGTVMRCWHSKSPSHALHGGAGSLRQLLQRTPPRSLGAVAWQRPAGPASPLPHPLQSPHTPSPAGGTAISLLGLLMLPVSCGFMWGSVPAPDHEMLVRGSCALYSIAFKHMMHILPPSTGNL